MPHHLRSRSALRCWAVIGGLVASLAGAAEPHEARQGEFVLRSTLAARSELAPAAAARNDIPRGPHQAVLSVTLLRAADGKSVPATASASSRNERGERRKILLREVAQGGQNAYIGSFEFDPGEQLQFVVEARPAEGKDKPLLSLAYRERMPPE